MGVIFIVKSRKNPAMYAEDDPEQYLKYAWRDIRWEEIFQILGFDMNPYMYYEDDNIREPSQVEYMRDHIQAMLDGTYHTMIYVDPAEYEEMKKRFEVLREDAVWLLRYFNYYVENEAYFEIY
jgi:hypothetical protein